MERGKSTPPQLARAAQRALGVLGDLRRRSLHNWRLKVGAFVLAAAFWFLVSMDDTVISQRTLRAPLNVEGLSSNQLASGVPSTVEVRLSGPAHRIGALNPTSIDAVLDLRGTSGAFEQPVRVFPPQGISLVGVQPSEVLGSIETQLERTVAVEVALVGGAPSDLHLEVQALPREVSVSGPEGQVAEVARVLAPFRPDQGATTVTVYAADEAGLPLSEVVISPAEVELTPSEEVVLHTRRVGVVLRPLSLPSLAVRSATLSQPEALLAGLEAELGGLEQVRATAALADDVGPGVYTLELALELPEGVSALEAPTLEVELAEPAPSEPAPPATVPSR